MRKRKIYKYFLEISSKKLKLLQYRAERLLNCLDMKEFMLICRANSYLISFS
jgi:hypothetical protein